MLSNLASYLGYSSAPVDRTPPSTVTADVRVRDEEDDWVLVDPNEREGGTMATQPSDGDDGVTRVTLAISTCPASLPGSSKNLSRSVSLDISCPLQESWYLTPPPSFSSDGPVHMETSPLENMLIEHPSMSVYEHTSLSGPSSQTATAVTTSTPAAATTAASPSPDEDPAMMTARPASPTSASRPLTRKEKLKMSRNKVNASKFSKKLTAKRANEEGECEDTEAKTLEAKEPKIKSFVKSPRRSGQSQRVPNVGPFDEVISGNGKCEIGSAGSEPQVVPTRKLYSEVLASKPKAETPIPAAEESQTVIEPIAPEAKEQEVPETAAAESPLSESSVPTAVENEMSVEESPEEGLTEEGDETSDRRRGGAVQTMVDHQQRQNFLTRSAQKMKNLGEEPSASDSDQTRPFFRSKGRKKCPKMH